MTPILPQPWLRSAASRLARHFRRWLPCSCLLCGADSPDELVCAACAADLPVLSTPGCPHCAEPTSFGERCGSCLRQAPHFEQTIAAWRYDFPIDRLIHAMKYGHQLAIADWCGRQIARRIAASGAPRFDRILPLPLHAARLAERGFNQAAEIARTVGRQVGCPVACADLDRRRPTASQAELPLAARHANVRGAFESRRDFSGQHILLIDDVMTSGATLDECARVIRLHGAASVTLGVVARALKHA